MRSVRGRGELDTNILIYTITTQDEEKAVEVLEEALRNPKAYTVSVQVAETVSVVSSKPPMLLPER